MNMRVHHAFLADHHTFRGSPHICIERPRIFVDCHAHLWTPTKFRGLPGDMFGRPLANVDVHHALFGDHHEYAGCPSSICGCPRTFVGGHVNSWKSTREFWAHTWKHGQPSHIYGRSCIASWTSIMLPGYADGVTRLSMAVHGYGWRVTRLCGHATIVDGLPRSLVDAHENFWAVTSVHGNSLGAQDTVVGVHDNVWEVTHLVGRPLQICGHPTRIVDSHVIVWAFTRICGRSRFGWASTCNCGRDTGFVWAPIAKRGRVILHVWACVGAHV